MSTSLLGTAQDRKKLVLPCL